MHRILPRKITLQELRARLGVTQEELAYQAGVNRNTVSAIEYDPGHGIRLMTAWRIVKAANRLRDSRELPYVCIEHIQWHIKGVDHLPTLCNCDKPYGLRAIRACYGLSLEVIQHRCAGLCVSEWYRAATGQPITIETAMAILEAVNGWLSSHDQPLVLLDQLALNIVPREQRKMPALSAIKIIPA